MQSRSETNFGEDEMPSALNAKIPAKYPSAELLVTKALNDSEAGMWHWMDRYADKVIFEKRILFWTVRLTVGQLWGFIREMLDDEEPKKLAA